MRMENSDENLVIHASVAVTQRKQNLGRKKIKINNSQSREKK